ncbi:MAG: RagB/SusD family nutrient uptake outer membrane protein [Bacteroidales bacterium]|nr:RagB/SusD family nutrient uptake outer membrane protein [Bacteroidales bacterium]
MKMKSLSILAAAALFSGAVTSCVDDLDVTPIDPNVTLPETVLDSEDAYAQLLAKCYVSLSVSGSEGPDKDPDIDGVDGGFGQYVRALFYMQEFTTDEALIVWNDKTVMDLHTFSYTASDVFVTAMFSRIYYQISLCNEFIRRASASEFAGSENIKTMIAEARALRALSYYHAIDMFGDVPFADENSVVGAVGPDQKSRADLFHWLDDECADIIDNSAIKGTRQNVYGRLDVNFVKMIRAHLNLNARVYLGLADDAAAKEYYDVAATMSKEVVAAYPALRANYADLFCGENHLCTDEIIFGVQQDGTYTQSYGVTCFIIKASCKGGDKATAAALGIDDGWGGTLVTPEFISKFDASDVRYRFWGAGQDMTSSQSIDVLEFDYGWSSYKFTNLNMDGSAPAIINFPSTDFPLFRAADAYLMLAEAQLRGASTVSAAEGQAALNAVRNRAGLGNGTYTLAGLLDERGRELYWECWRRSDLVRYGLLTGNDYLWTWKGGLQSGRSVDDKYNLFPIPVSELNSNSKLSQNEAWK